MKKGRRHASLQIRIAVFFFLSFFTVFMLFMTARDFQWTGAYNREVNRLFVNRAQLVGHIWAEEIQRGDDGIKERMDEDLEVSSFSVAIYDPYGRLQYERNPTNAIYAPSTVMRKRILADGPNIETVHGNGRDFRVVRTAFFAGKRLDGFICAEFPLDVLSSVQKTLLHFIPVMAVALLGVAFLLSRLLTAGVLRSIGTVTNATNRISNERFDESIDVSKLDVEFQPLAENFNRMGARLGDTFATLKRFTSDASHELRTPLSIIRLRLETTLQRERDVEEYIEAISESIDAVDRLSRTVNTLLMMVRSESGGDCFNKTRIDLNEIIGEVAEFISPIVENSELRLDVSLNGAALMQGDEEWLRHVVFNLLDNAVKFSPPGGTIAVELNLENDTYVLRVTDTGQGIPPEHLPFIFDRFYKVKTVFGETGAGLGLALCRWVVAGHNGEIAVKSEPEEGTTFIVTLPAE